MEATLKIIPSRALISSIIATCLTILLLLIISSKVSTPMLLAERFFGEIGQIQILFHGLYSGIVTYLFLTSKNKKKIRQIIWTLFMIVFFGQLLLGLVFDSNFLQTGNLHYPVPALIISTPIFTGGSMFMILLILSTIILVGPSWCSHLCYIGALDNFLANRKQYNKFRPTIFIRLIRPLILLIAIILPIILKKVQPSEIYLHYIIIIFIVVSTVFFYLSYKYATMIHCSYFCPVGLVITLIAKINPFKIKINKSCTLCGKCTKACKYRALTIEDVKKREPNYRCTLCCDCIQSCHHKSIQLRFFNKLKSSQIIFYPLVVSLHSIFMSVARI